jgi:Na+-transporting methylmalonyl-CoA/oxaloacetate decarboxylase gamma subunit
MTKRVLAIAWKRLASLRTDDSGAALVITLAVFFFLFMLVSGVYTVGEAVNRRIELQKACDAAAYSAAVVQADGLSRMATVNRAMAWTYVQMVRRQMDYITYRWLKLTYKNYMEDRKAAKNFHFCLMPCNKKHNKEGVGWWCGQGAKSGMDKIRLNFRFNITPDDLKEVLDDMESAMGDGDSSASSLPSNVPDTVADDDELFVLRPDLSDVKKEVYATIRERTAQGEVLGPAEIREIYREIYVREYPEPTPHGSDEWRGWNDKFTMFAALNLITENDYICKKCGKGMMEVNHGDCMRAIADQQAVQEEEEEEQAPDNVPTSKYGWGKKVGDQIRNDKKTIEMTNLALDAIGMNMTLGIRQTAQQVLELNLPKDADGKIPADFRYALHIPTGGNPYGQAGIGDASLPGIFSPLYNTEEHETLFLNMMDGDVHGMLLDYFAHGKTSSGLLSLLTGDKKAPGLDQWFIRTYPRETLINNKRNIRPTWESYHAEGISRSYKNANRAEGSCITGQSRANHVMSIGDSMDVGGGSDMLGIGDIFSEIFDSIKQHLDLSPSCQNRRSRFPEMCRKVDDSVALVSQYRWCSAKWFCYFVVYTFGIKWKHPFFPKFYCSDHGYGTFWLKKQFKALTKGSTRKDYRPCFMGFDQTFILKGHARIYGDDRDLVDENYVGTPARPWLVNEKFFGGDGTITVGLARRQRNPWQRVMQWFHDYDANSPNVSNGLLSLFNVNKDNFLWTVSTARAAYRRRSDGFDSGEANYDMKYDVSAYPDALEIDYASDATSGMKKLRVGCVCEKGDNKARLERAWNLGTPDWDATLLPVRYAKRHISKYETWNGASAGKWDVAGQDMGQEQAKGAFETLADLRWFGFGEQAETSTQGYNVMQSVYIDGKELENWRALEKLKIY